MNQDLADIIALQAVTYLLSDEKRISWLLGETGLSTTELQQSPDTPEILAGILDFLMAHEDMLIDFCDTNKIDPASFQRMRHFFPGGEQEYQSI